MKPRFRTLATLVLLVAVGQTGWAEGTKAQTTLKGHKGLVVFLAFTADGKTLASSSLYDGAKLWDLGKGKVRKTFEGGGPVALTGDGKTLAGFTDRQTLTLWDVASGKKRATLKWVEGKVPKDVYGTPTGLRGLVQCLAFTPDGKTLASGHGDQAVRLWDGSTGKEKGVIRGLRGVPFALAFSPDGRRLACSSFFPAERKQLKYELTLWEVAGHKQIARSVGPDWVNCLAFAPDGKLLAGDSLDGSVRLWDAATGKEQACLKGHSGWVSGMTFAQDGKTLVSAHLPLTDRPTGRGKVKVWDIPRLRERATLTLAIPPVDVGVLGLAPDGKTLAVGTEWGDVKLWDLSALLRQPSPKK
jgi:WD40 repeat protein